MSGSPDDRDSARARLQAVRERFASRLAARVDELLSEIERARTGDTELTAAIALAHRLAGTAGSFGYTEAGEQAAVVEAVLQRIASTTSAPPGRTDPVWSELDAAVQRLQVANPKPSPRANPKASPDPAG